MQKSLEPAVERNTLGAEIVTPNAWAMYFMYGCTLTP